MEQKTALLVIDAQNDYFEKGLFPLANTSTVLRNLTQTIARAVSQGMEVVHIQHVADPAYGTSPFFNAGTDGANIHSEVMAAAPNAPVIVKRFADAFHDTNLKAFLEDQGITKLLVSGMMTQNCVTHTALSKCSECYEVVVLSDCTTTVTELLHLIALHALSTRVAIKSASEALEV